ncbi:MAG: hypothetical protein ACKD6N_01855 [Candidatus Bathyarchaeota archaeon]
MKKHLLKISNISDAEALLYCPNMNRFFIVKLSLSYICPGCGLRLSENKNIKRVLEYNLSDFFKAWPLD